MEWAKRTQGMNDRLRFQIRKSKNNKFYFVQLARNGQVLSTSEMYERMQSAVDGAWSAGATEVIDYVSEPTDLKRGDVVHLEGNEDSEYMEMDDKEATPAPDEQQKDRSTAGDDVPDQKKQSPENQVTPNPAGSTEDALDPGTDPVAPESADAPASSASDQGPATGDSTGKESSGNA